MRRSLLNLAIAGSMDDFANLAWFNDADRGTYCSTEDASCWWFGKTTVLPNTVLGVPTREKAEVLVKEREECLNYVGTEGFRSSRHSV
jgi:hypothetical protein